MQTAHQLYNKFKHGVVLSDEELQQLRDHLDHLVTRSFEQETTIETDLMRRGAYSNIDTIKRIQDERKLQSMKVKALYAPHINSWSFNDQVEERTDVDEMRGNLIDYTNVDHPPEVLSQQQVQTVEAIIHKYIPNANVEIEYDNISS